MLFQKQCGYLLGAAGVCLLALGITSRGSAEDRAEAVKVWRELGRQVLFRLGTGRSASAAWLDRELEGADPNTAQGVRTAEFLLLKAFDAYGRDTLVVEGRLPLDLNPQCILGLYAAERFAGTRLGDWGRRQFQRCVEQTCLTVLLAAGPDWRSRLETEMLTLDQGAAGPFQGGAFAGAEAPYLYYYLVENAPSVGASQRARERLARCLWQGYGLESGLRQYLIAFGPSDPAEDTWLGGAPRLERLGPHALVKKLYERRLTNARSVEEARQAGEPLAGLLLGESRPRQAKVLLDLVCQRFPQMTWTAPAIQVFRQEFQENRAQTRRRWVGELVQMTSELQAWHGCRLLEALWTAEEAPAQWQTLVREVEAGTLAQQCGRVFLARALLRVGQTEAAAVELRELAGSVHPFVQAQSLALAAELAHARGQEEESVRLYAQALQRDRPTFLPDWCQGLVPVPSLEAGTSPAGLSAQRLFLQGYQDLRDGDYAAAVDSLSRAAADPQLPEALRRVVPYVMLWSCLGVGDDTEAETWGYRALEGYGKDHPEDGKVRDLLAKIQNLDLAVFHLVTAAREEAVDAAAASEVSAEALGVCEAGVSLALCEPLAGALGKGVQRLYVQVRQRRDAQVLLAEYGYLRQPELPGGRPARPERCEPLLFAAQVLGGESRERIRETLAAGAGDEGVGDRLYRFAVFALKARQLDLAASVLDTEADAPISAARAEVLETIAEMYLAASNHQKAIDIYLRIAANSQDPGKAQTLQLKVIDIHADILKDWDKAIRECEEFIRRYPDSPETSQLEFRIGKLAYLKKDYTGAASQLIAFQKKYPEHPQLGEAMLLAGLSRMAEGNAQEAIGRFTEVIRRYPDGELAAHSKFLIGYTQISEQQYAAATETFKQLIEQFPHSQYVTQARTLIDRLNKVSP